MTESEYFDSTLAAMVKSANSTAIALAHLAATGEPLYAGPHELFAAISDRRKRIIETHSPNKQSADRAGTE